jgi:hypothetical protein
VLLHQKAASYEHARFVVGSEVVEKMVGLAELESATSTVSR